MVWSVIQQFRMAYKYRGGAWGLLEHMYTVRTLSCSNHRESRKTNMFVFSCTRHSQLSADELPRLER